METVIGRQFEGSALSPFLYISEVLDVLNLRSWVLVYSIIVNITASRRSGVRFTWSVVTTSGPEADFLQFTLAFSTSSGVIG